MDRLQYLLLMAACVVVTLPLELVIGARVWRQPRRLARSLVPAGVLFVVWDLWASATGTWGFADRYTVGLTLPGGMAVEELVFFLVILNLVTDILYSVLDPRVRLQAAAA